MAPLVMVRYKPTGEVRAVDPDKWDVPGQVSGGQFEVVGQPPSPVTPPPMTAGGLARAFLNQPSKAETTAMQQGAMRGAQEMVPGARKVIGDAAPAMAAIALTSLIPESAPLKPLLRLLTAYGAGAAADVPGQMIQGNQPTLGHANAAGQNTAAGQLIGEILGGLTGAVGNKMAVDAAGANKAARLANPGIDQAILAERIPVGKPGTTAGLDEVNARIARAGEVRDLTLNKNSATRIPAYKILAGIDREIADLKASAHPEDLADAARLQARRDAFVEQNPDGLTKGSLDNAVRRSQNRARATYTKDVNGKIVTIQTTPDEQIYHRLFARTGRALLRSTPVDPADIAVNPMGLQGAKTFGDVKDRLATLEGVQDVYRNTEAMPEPKLSDFGNVPAIPRTAMRGTILRPDIASRIGFALNNPGLVAVLRNSPNAAQALFTLLGQNQAQQ